MRARRRSTFALVVLVGIIPLAGCGSSNPGYCSKRDDLRTSVQDLGNVKLAQSGGIQNAKAALQKVDSSAKSMVDAAKADFPTESSAVSTSVSNLDAKLGALPSSPAPQELLQVGGQVKNVADAMSAFGSATKDKCS